MQKQPSLFIIGLVIAIWCQPLFCLTDVKAQSASATLASNSPGIRYGMNCEAAAYTEMAYTDVCMAASWAGGTSLGSNGYPNTAGTTTTLFFSLLGDNPGQQIYNFYGEGIFNISPVGIFAGGIVPGSLQKTVNSKGVTVTTAQLTYNIPQPSPGAFSQGVPLSTINII